MIFIRNKTLDNKIKHLEELTEKCSSLIETITQYHNNGKVLVLEDMTEALFEKLQDLAKDDRTIIIFSKDGHRIEIHEKDGSLAKKKVYF